MTPLVGVPCDPAAPICPEAQACIATATGTECLPIGTPPVVDAAVDAVSEVGCPGDPALSVCFAFDTPVLASPLANEGRVDESADLVNVTHIARGQGGAAQVGVTSSISIPANTTVIDIVAMEAAILIDAVIPDGARAGIVDGDGADPGMSMFVFGRVDTHEVRCTLGSRDLFGSLAIVPGVWVELSCVCDADTLTIRVDGVAVAEAPNCLPSASTTFGLQIGQNNQNGNGLPPNDHLIGAIDNVRLWTAPPP